MILDTRDAWREIAGRLDRSGGDFDSVFGTDTGADELHVERLPPDGTRYQPTRVGAVLEALRVLELDLPRWTLLDLGSGKGRIPLLGAAIGFRRSIGVEVRHDLHEVALHNLASCRRRGLLSGQCSFIRANVADVAIPTDATLLFAFNPFGARTLAGVLGGLCDARDAGHESRLLYVNPIHASTVDAMPAAARIGEGEGWLAWRFR